MKVSVKALLLLLVTLLVAQGAGEAGRVSVKGYYRKDGTYVSPHTRSSPGSGYSGYSSSSYGSSSAASSSGMVAPSSASFGGRAVTTSNLNLRQTQSTAARVITVIPRGAVVTIGSCGAGWCKVDYGRFYGYVSQTHIQVVSSGASALSAAPSGGSRHYANCAAARSAGAAPLLRGQPGYRGALDRDNDGIACE